LEYNKDNNDIQELINRYDQFLNSDGDSYLDADEFAELAEYYSDELGDDNMAQEIIDQALEVFPDALCLLAFKARFCLLYGADTDKAEQYIERAQDKSDIEYHYVKAEIILTRDGGHAADDYLVGYYADVIQHESQSEIDDYFFDVANLFFDYEEYTLCMEWLQRSFRKEGSDYLYLYARTLFRMGVADESEKIFNQLLNDYPFEVDLWQDIALAQFVQDKIPEAITSLDYALAIEPDNEDAIYNKELLMLMLGSDQSTSGQTVQLSH